MWEVYSDGKTPYPGMKNMDCLRKVTQEKYRMEAPMIMPPEAAEVMKAAWLEDKDKRPSFAEIRKKLSKVQKNLKK